MSETNPHIGGLFLSNFKIAYLRKECIFKSTIVTKQSLLRTLWKEFRFFCFLFWKIFKYFQWRAVDCELHAVTALVKSVICEGRGQHQIIIFRVMNGESEEERNEKAVGIVMVKAIITKLGYVRL